LQIEDCRLQIERLMPFKSQGKKLPERVKKKPARSRKRR